MSVASNGNAVKLENEEPARLRAENTRLRSENDRLYNELNEDRQLLWSRPEAASAKEFEDFKERQSVWAYLARRAKDFADRFRASPGILTRFESMTAALRHSVSTAAEMNLYHNPNITDAEKEALWEAYTEQLRFVEAINNLTEPLKRRVLEVVKKKRLACRPIGSKPPCWPAMRRGCSLIPGSRSSSHHYPCRVHGSLRGRGSALRMMALGGAGASMCEAHCSYEHRNGSRDLAIAIVPAGTAYPLFAGILSYATGCAASINDQLKSVPSTHIRCRMTASLRATATFALRKPLRLVRRTPPAFSVDHLAMRVSRTLAAS